MRRRFTAMAAVTATGLAFLTTAPAQAAPATPGDFTVVSADGVSAADAVAAIKAAGGTIVSSSAAVGVSGFSAPGSDLGPRAPASNSLTGASTRRAIGVAPNGIEKVTPGVARGNGHGGPAT